MERPRRSSLLAAGGTYAGLWRTQSGGFLGEADGDGSRDRDGDGKGDGQEAAAGGRLVVPR